MSEEAKIRKIATQIEGNFEIDGLSTAVDQIKDRADFIERLAQFVKRMMEGDFERFLSLMYRLDVSEKKLKEAMDTADPGEVYIKISEIIVEREEKKIFWREKYKD